MPISIPHCLGWRFVARCVVVAASFAALPAQAATGLSDVGGMIREKWDTLDHAVRSGQWETYVTGYAWHLPFGYANTTRARLNERTWGGGFGRTLHDEDGDRHSVYVMAFSDSHRALQMNLGYAWQRYWSPTRDFGVGLGYLAFLFSREDVANHCPIPAVLPCASIRYRGLELIGLFVPRVSRDIKGDVIFVYLRMPLGETKRTA